MTNGCNTRMCRNASHDAVAMSMRCHELAPVSQPSLCLTSHGMYSGKYSQIRFLITPRENKMFKYYDDDDVEKVYYSCRRYQRCSNKKLNSKVTSSINFSFSKQQNVVEFE